MITDGLEYVEFMTTLIAFKFIGRHVTVPLQIGPISLNTTATYVLWQFDGFWPNPAEFSCKLARLLTALFC